MPASPPTIGNHVQCACTWEVLARKAGNVCPGREFPDLRVDDFLVSAQAIAPILEQAPRQALGVTILHAIEATRQATATNTNLGIVLLLAPLASTPLDRALRPGLAEVLRQTTIADARHVYAAIRLAHPGGLGEALAQDVRDEPTLPLQTVMELAHERDLIARQYAADFALVFDEVAPALVRNVERYQTLEHGIVATQLDLLSRHPDSLVSRKLGAEKACALQGAAAGVLALGLDTPKGRAAFVDFDAWLRADNHARNPGTTADLLAAGLFVALREQQIPPTMPFPWAEHPFQASGEKGSGLFFRLLPWPSPR